MSNALSIFDKPNAGVPAYLQDSEEESNLSTGGGVNSLSFEGKVWAITLDGEKTRLVKTDEDGDEAPISTMRVVILDFNKNRGRAYYEGSYDPNNPGAPKCWSDDGKKPHESVPADDKQCDTCANCPMAAKGSRVTDQGKAVQACSQHRMMAVLPANWVGKEVAKPLRMKIAVTSDYDKENKEQEAKGWYAFKQFQQMLAARGVKHSANVVTKMKFDASVAYPKLLFSAERFLEEDEWKAVKPMISDEGTKSLLAGTYSPAGPDGVDVSNENSSAGAGSKVQDIEIEDAAEEPEEPKKKEEAKAEKPKAEPEVLDAEEKPDEKKAAEVPDDVAALLDEWS